MSYADDIARARRLAILMQLYFAAGYTANLLFLRDQVEHTGYGTSLDRMATEMDWLVEQDFVERLEQGAYRLTQRGEDIALGRTQSSGIKRPSVGESQFHQPR